MTNWRKNLINIKEYGYRGDENVPDGLEIGRVTAVHRERYELVSKNGTVFGKLKAGIYYHTCEESFPTVGDFVYIRSVGDGDCLIVKTLPRASFFARLDPDPKGGKQQAVAANIDTVFIMTSLNHDFNVGRLERYLALTRQSKAKPVIILTKADLVGDYETENAIAIAVAGDAPVIPVSVVDGTGLDEVRKFLLPGFTVVFLGMSGVGKSSLLNKLIGDEVMSVKAVRESDSRGRHTTTHRQLFMLPGGAMVIDTPGMRTMGMWEADEGLSQTFADVEALANNCRFADCRHEGEPGCAIHSAIANGEITDGHWQNYVKLKKETSYAEQKAEHIRIKSARNKLLAMEIRQSKAYGKRKRNGH